MKKNKSFYVLIWMILLSLSLGVFISYFFVFVNALFISEIGTSKLPVAYIISGLGGTLITWLFNISEKRFGFGKASTTFCLLFALVMFLQWHFFIKGDHLYYLIFFSYAWFWVCINFTALVFWKLPSNIFNLNENKKYNGIISTGEVISAIIAYLSVPVLLTLESFTRDKLLLISFFGITAFSIITFFLGQSIKPASTTTQSKKKDLSTSKSLTKEPYFQLIFLSVFLAVIIQLLIDFSLMEISANQLSDPKELAKYFAFLFGGMRLLELILKTFISKYLVREYGVFISLTTLIFVLAFIAIIGVSSLLIGYSGIILIVASLSKVFERSLYRSVYAPTINVLYQAYPPQKRALTQNYADGFGKTIGQVIAAVVIFAIATIPTFQTRIFVLLIGILIILTLWYFISNKLIVYYKAELASIIKSLQIRQGEELPINQNLIQQKSTTKDNDSFSFETPHTDQVSIKTLLEQIISLVTIETTQITKTKFSIQYKTDEKSLELEGTIQSIMLNIQSYQTSELQYFFDQLLEVQQKNAKDSKLIALLLLFIQVKLTKKNERFNFHHYNKRNGSINFLTSALIQNFTANKSLALKKEDYYFLLEERIEKYTYLLATLQDFNKSTTILPQLINLELKSTLNDILYSLNFNHNPQLLNQIVLMLNLSEKTQELIALELLELVLDEQEKKWILPILRENDHKKVLAKLEAEFPQALLGNEKRLISILSNIQLDIPSIIKSQALVDLVTYFPNQSNYQLAKTMAKFGFGSFPFFETQQMNEKNGFENTQNDNPQMDFLKLNTPQQFENSNLSKSLAYSYWAQELEVNSFFENPLVLVYRKLYFNIFPKEQMSNIID